ncbi:MAG: TonB family protein, partial [Cytophagales bacterium]
MIDPILKDSWLEMVFQNRNKEYGAYELRKIYSKNVIAGFIISVTIFSLGLSAPLIAEMFKKEEVIEEEFEMKEVVLAEPPPLDPNTPPPPPPPPVPPPPKIASVKFQVPEIKPDELVKEDPPKMDDLKDKVISKVNQEGEKGIENIIEEVVVAKENKVIEVAVKEEPVIYAEEKPEFPGGYQSFFAKNIKYPQQAAKMGIEGKVFLQFVVEKDGSITEPKILKDPGYGLGEEALRVLMTMPKWSPAKMNGKAVFSCFCS